MLYEVRELKAPYWFNNEEVARVQELNLDYTARKDIGEIVSACFRKPQEGEVVKGMDSKQILKMIQSEYPSVAINHSTKVHLGLAMKELGFEHINRGNVQYYKAVPLRAA